MCTQAPHTSTQESAVSPVSCPFRVLAKLADILEPTGLQEEAELPVQILAEFVMVCSKWQPAFQKPVTAPGSYGT